MPILEYKNYVHINKKRNVRVQTSGFLSIMYSFIRICQKLVKKYFQMGNMKMLLKHQLASAAFMHHIKQLLLFLPQNSMASKFFKFHCHSMSSSEVLRESIFVPFSSK